MPNRLLLALAERPAIKKLIVSHPSSRSVVNRFVAGETVEDGVGVAERMNDAGVGSILDYLGEHIANETQADAAAALYIDTLEQIAIRTPGTHISVKLTQLGLDLSFEGCMQRLEKICAKAAEIGTTVAIDMESHEHTDRSIETYKALRGAHSNLVLCLQAYLKRTPDDVDSLLPLDPAIRLCKGAYNEPSDIVLTRRDTTRAYLEILESLLSATSYTAVATHDDALIRGALRLSRELSVSPERYEFQMLYGVRRELQRLLAELGFSVRVYVPFGSHWYPYLMRRLAERPANLRLFLESLLRG